MGKVNQIAQDFWFAFDNEFHDNISDKVDQEYKVLFSNSMDELLFLWWRSRREPNYPDSFEALLNATSRISIKNLLDLQYNIISHYLHNSIQMESAFIDFGQGILFDPRRRNGMKIHRMDGGSPDIYIGYYRWHAFLRAASLVEKASDADPGLQRLLELDQLVALAWVIQREMNPRQDDETGGGQDPENKAMNPERIDELKKIWRAKGFDELDNDYDNEELHTYLQQVFQVQ
jgi:hypothetical protein